MKLLLAILVAPVICFAQTLPPPPGSLFRVPDGWSELAITSVAASPTIPDICKRASNPVHVETMIGTSPSGPFSYTICETDFGLVGWWRINPQSNTPLAEGANLQPTPAAPTSTSATP